MLYMCHFAETFLVISYLYSIIGLRHYLVILPLYSIILCTCLSSILLLFYTSEEEYSHEEEEMESEDEGTKDS